MAQARRVRGVVLQGLLQDLLGIALGSLLKKKLHQFDIDFALLGTRRSGVPCTNRLGYSNSMAVIARVGGCL